MKTITTNDDWNAAIQSDHAIIMFSAVWCPDCVIVQPIMREIEEEYDEFDYFYVDRDEHIELCQELGIFGIPSFLAYRNGKEVGRYVDKQRKTKEQIEDFLQSIG
ncbi:thioredoxin family protein [Pseudalkalibacillus salsuginis]|uniref:thioredoxin family protein n=1 Tax=Pseudalkalibacillus salsuginis TaxID=2910972 RepID=UPI001F260972|nr:thioredoxin family protein [Pseudalkalibacillus salsuginis]MCF6408821.1 thioredoxin family protein [Pseudalkalibacillus salsuginis]